MSRPCRVCVHSAVVKIDGLLCQGLSPYAIAPMFSGSGLSPYSIDRHRKSSHHLKKVEETKANSTEELNEWIRRADSMWRLAEEKRELPRMDKAATLAAKFMELRMKRDGELLTDSQIRQQDVRRGKEALPDDDRVPLEVLDRILNSVEGRKVT